MPTQSTEKLPRRELSPPGELALARFGDVRLRMHEGLGLLLQAHDYARDLDQDAWSLAVELPALRAAQLSNSDLRWLAAKGYIEHAVETTGPDDRVRRFRRTPLLTFTDSTCIVLTRGGATVAREVCSADFANVVTQPRVGICRAPGADDLPGRPTWDHQRRQLRLDSEIVKEFKLPSPNQETVLMAFEEEGWPVRIDDPLSPQAELDPRRRLHDTIKALNRKQKRNQIRFRGDGSGEGIRWEPVSDRSNA